MADVKISALPAASAGAVADLVPIVQSGTTKYVTIANMLKVAPAIGGTTPAAGAFTTLTASGVFSVTDATEATSATVASLTTAGGLATVKSAWIGDDLTVAGNNVAIGTTTSPQHGLRLWPSLSGAVAQIALNMGATFDSSATTYGAGIVIGDTIANSAFTMIDHTSIRVYDATKGASATVTNNYGIYIENQIIGGTLNIGLRSLVSSGTGKWNIYASGTAQNAFVGNVRIGSTTPPTVALDVTGAILASTTITATGAFGCNTKTAQTAYASGGALSAYGAGANGFDSGANASALHAMVVSIRAALVANGIMS